MTYGFIGCGNMGGAIATAVCKAVDPKNVLLANRTIEKAERLASVLGCRFGSNEDAAQCDFVFLGVKPYYMEEMLFALRDVLAQRNGKFVLVTMAAGLRMEKMRSYVGDNFVGGLIRIMPNLPCALGEGIVLYSTMGASNEDEKAFVSDFSGAGLLDKIDEKDMDGGSALTGCGPAFVYYFAEGLIEGAIKCGIDKEKAPAYAAQTILGGAKMLLTGEEPAVLRKKVCSPKGTTLEGIKALDEGEFLKVVSAAVEAAERRAKELQKNS